MRAEFTAFHVVHHALEQVAEDFGADFRPVAFGALQQQFAQFGVEIKFAELFFKQFAVHIGKGAQFGVHVLRAAFGRGVEHGKQAVERAADVFAVFAGVFFQVAFKLSRLENQGVVGKKAEQQADEELFQAVFVVAAVGAEGLIKAAHCGGGFDVGLLLGLAQFVGDAVHEVEMAQFDVFGQVGKREENVCAVFQIVEFHGGEIGHDDVAWHVFGVVPADFFHIAHRLFERGIEVFAGGFVLAKQPARPKYVGKFGVPAAVFDGVFGGGGAEAVQPENGEKFVPKGVFFGTLALFVLEAAGKLGGKAVFVFVGVGGHGGEAFGLGAVSQ